MLSILLPAPLVGVLKVASMLTLLLAWFCVILPGVLLKLLPHPWLRRLAGRYCVAVATQWAASNQLLYRLLQPMHLSLDNRVQPQPGSNYLLICNHQSWADIPVLLDVLHGRTPFPRFFLKHELLYMPIIGLVCWAMDFPFMKRHAPEAVAANPALRNEDLAATRRACAIYRSEPVTVANFVEGTRFSEAKRLARQSPYRHLLRPKAAGLAFTLNAMGEQFAGLIDVTIAYRPTGRNLLWSWLCGEQDELALHIDVLPIPQELLQGDYEADAEYRSRVQAWLNGIWQRKDARLERMLAERQAMSTPRPAHS